MSLIVAARFDTFEKAEHAAQALFTGGFDQKDVSIFFVGPRGQHNAYPIGGDVDAAPGARHAHQGAGIGIAAGAALGCALGLMLFPAAGLAAYWAIVTAAAGAYAGSLIGAMRATHNRQTTIEQRPSGELEQVKPRASGVLLSVHVSNENQAQASQILRQENGQDIEQAHGEWQAGKWVDFDPVEPSHLLARAR